MTESKKPNEYFKWLIEAYAELRHQRINQGVTHRVVAYDKGKNGHHEVSVQVIGKNLIFKTSPTEIMADDSLLESFSKKDIRLLTFLACEDIKEPQHEVVGQKFVRALNKFFFRLRHGRTGEEIEKSAEEISADPELIKKLHPQDAHTVGYVTANEQIKAEKQAQQKD